jgi:hypothetical protein
MIDGVRVDTLATFDDSGRACIAIRARGRLFISWPSRDQGDRHYCHEITPSGWPYVSSGTLNEIRAWIVTVYLRGITGILTPEQLAAWQRAAMAIRDSRS